MSPRRDGIRAHRFREPLASEQRSARWAHKLTELSEQVPTPARSGVRARLLGWLAHLFTVTSVLPFLERAEHADAVRYQHDSEAIAAMAIDEGSHARALTRLRESDGTDDPRSIQHRERWHRGDRSGALRGGVWSQRRISVEHLACDGGRRFGGVGFDSAAAIRRRWRCSTRFHDLPPGGGPRWCLACLSNCGYCNARSRAGRSDWTHDVQG